MKKYRIKDDVTKSLNSINLKDTIEVVAQPIRVTIQIHENPLRDIGLLSDIIQEESIYYCDEYGNLISKKMLDLYYDETE